MKKLKVYAVVVVAFAVVVGILLRNRAQIKAETRKVNVDSYSVNVATVSKQDVMHHIDLVGTVQANYDVVIVSEAQGKVTKIMTRVGDYEPAGAELMQVDDKVEAAALELAKVNLAKAEKDYKRYQQLYKENSVTDSQLEIAKVAYESANDQFVVARHKYDNTRITTPISGIVTARNADIGSYVSSREPVAEVVDISRLKIFVDMDEHDVFEMHDGEKVKITTGVYPGVGFTGIIKTISPKGDADHNYPVEVDLINSRRHPLRAGMFAHVDFTVRQGQESLVIPRQTLVGSVESPQVYVVQDGTARLKNIVVGSTYDSELEVVSGLHEGEAVVTNGQDNLQDGMKVTVVSDNQASPSM